MSDLYPDSLVITMVLTKALPYFYFSWPKLENFLQENIQKENLFKKKKEYSSRMTSTKIQEILKQMREKRKSRTRLPTKKLREEAE